MDIIGQDVEKIVESGIKDAGFKSEKFLNKP